MNTNDTMNLVAMRMAQELAQELHAAGIYYDLSDEPSEIFPFAICNIGGRGINAIATFKENKRSSESYFSLSDGNDFKAKVGSLNEAMMTIRAQGCETKLDRELANLAKAIRLTGRNAEVDKSDTLEVRYNGKLAKSVIYNGKVIDVIIYGYSPCYAFEGKWTYRLEELFTWLGIDSFNGIKLYTPVEFSYDKYNVKCEAVGVFIGFRFDWEHNRGTRTLANVGAFSWVVSEGELLGGGIESDNMKPYTITEDKPFICGYRGEVRMFNLVGAHVLPELQAHAKLVKSEEPDDHYSVKLAANWLKLEQPIIDIGRDGAIEYVSSRDVGLHVKGEK